MSLLYNGNKEKRDPKEFKKLLADLENRRKKGVVPKNEQVEELNSKNEENAILRKKLAGLDNGEFETYNTYVEYCKTKIKELLK